MELGTLKLEEISLRVKSYFGIESVYSICADAEVKFHSEDKAPLTWREFVDIRLESYVLWIEEII